MVITITMKNVRLRNNGIYEFRIRVPADCVDAVGKKEHTESLKTKDDAEAAIRAKKLTALWKNKFKQIRTAIPSPVQITEIHQETVSEFREKLNAHMRKHLLEFLDQFTNEELYELSNTYQGNIGVIKADKSVTMNFSTELGITYPLPTQKSPGMMRRLNNVIIEALEEIRLAIDEEAGRSISQEIEQELLDLPKLPNTQTEPPPTAPKNGQSLAAVTQLMLDAKNLDGKFASLLTVETGLLQEWAGQKTDISEYTKTELVDYTRNCLPYIPKNMHHGSAYKNKTLKECVKLTKEDPSKYVPISHRTCENRLTGLQMVFNYAKNDLGIITTNPAKGIEIPKIRVTGGKPLNYTRSELQDMWNALEHVAKTADKRPERLWVPVLGLYHGFRLNEICSLLIKDIYQTEDGIYLIDVNENGVNKTVKNKSSIRTVPIHPFVLNSLRFQDFIEEKKNAGSEDDRLFSNLTYVYGQGYAKKLTVWFGKWKKTWLPQNSQYKNFHSLRHTFIQQAQNQAKMSDRCCQEITGHAVEGVSAVHLGYSGGLTPKTMLEELEKLQYGWEDEPRPVIEPPPKPEPKTKNRRYTKRKTAAQKSRSQ